MDEGSGLLLMLVTALSRKRRKALDRIPITVGMLVTAARLGTWDSAKVENGRWRRPRRRSRAESAARSGTKPKPADVRSMSWLPVNLAWVPYNSLNQKIRRLIPLVLRGYR